VTALGAEMLISCYNTSIFELSQAVFYHFGAFRFVFLGRFAILGHFVLSFWATRTAQSLNSNAGAARRSVLIWLTKDAVE
jgi:hypothetical protein